MEFEEWPSPWHSNQSLEFTLFSASLFIGIFVTTSSLSAKAIGTVGLNNVAVKLDEH